MSGIPIRTVGDLQTIEEKAECHAKYALPIMAPLLMAVLQLADNDSLRATKNHYESFGQQLRFTFKGEAFKLKNTGRADRSVILAYSHSTLTGTEGECKSNDYSCTAGSCFEACDEEDVATSRPRFEIDGDNGE